MNILETLDETTMQGAVAIFRALGLEVTGTDPAELRKYRNRLMMQHHPDRTGNTKAAQKINAAYDILTGKQSPRATPSTGDQGQAGPAGYTRNAERGTPVWARAGYSGALRPNATISRSNYTDINFIKMSMWELSGRSQEEYAIWGFDGAAFRNAVTVYGSPRIFFYMATAMLELQTKGCRPCACRAVIVTDNGNRNFWLIYADGKYFDDPISLEHGSFNDNPSNDHSFRQQLPDLLDRLQEHRVN